jgi:cytochrome c oxidase subunit 2
MGSRTTIAGGILQNTPEGLAGWLRDPAAVKPGSLMPNVGLTEEEIDALVAFLLALE